MSVWPGTRRPRPSELIEVPDLTDEEVFDFLRDYDLPFDRTAPPRPQLEKLYFS